MTAENSSSSGSSSGNRLQLRIPNSSNNSNRNNNNNNSNKGRQSNNNNSGDSSSHVTVDKNSHSGGGVLRYPMNTSSSSSSSGNNKVFGLCASTQLLHQRIELHFYYDDVQNKWHYHGYTDLYVLTDLTDDKKNNNKKCNNNKMKKVQLSIQLRDCISIRNVSIHSPILTTTTTKNSTPTITNTKDSTSSRNNNNNDNNKNSTSNSDVTSNDMKNDVIMNDSEIDNNNSGITDTKKEEMNSKDINATIPNINNESTMCKDDHDSMKEKDETITADTTVSIDSSINKDIIAMSITKDNNEDSSTTATNMKAISKIEGTNTTTTITNNNHNSSTTKEQQQDVVSLKSLYVVSQHHLDPLSTVLYKPASTYTATTIPTNTYNSDDDDDDDILFEADSQCCRGAMGMTDSLRCASLSSQTCGQVQLSCVLPNTATTTSTTNGNHTTTSNNTNKKKLVMNCWKKDILETTQHYTNVKKYKTCYKKQKVQRQERISYLTQQLTKHSRLVSQSSISSTTNNDQTNIPPTTTSSSATNTPDNTPSSRNANNNNNNNNNNDDVEEEENKKIALKVSLEFELSPSAVLAAAAGSSSLHLGGFHLIHGGNTPYVYTTPGLLGDVTSGPTCWVPTLDSAKWSHRASRVISIHVTSNSNNGLWATGCGHDFGWNQSYRYYQSKLTATTKNNTDTTIFPMIGKHHVDFLKQSLSPSSSTDDDCVLLATSIWTSFLWSACSSRSLGFVVGPFDCLYDDEYYNLEQKHSTDNNNENNDNNRTDDGKEMEEDDRPPSIEETAHMQGEGIRQLYLLPPSEHMYLHSHAPIINLYTIISPDQTTTTNNNITMTNGCFSKRSYYNGNNSGANNINKHHQYQYSNNQLLRNIQSCLRGATTGVPHRALILMQQILNFPICYTSSYTQVWLPLRGECSGTLANMPQINGCGHVFYGGTILNGCMLPPFTLSSSLNTSEHTTSNGLSSSSSCHKLDEVLRFPFYQGGRELQLIQARCVIRGWILSRVPLGGDDIVGDGYIHIIMESLFMSYYERAYGGSGEGGSPTSWFYQRKQIEKNGVGIHSPNLDFLPISNIPHSERSSSNNNSNHHRHDKQINSNSYYNQHQSQFMNQSDDPCLDDDYDDEDSLDGYDTRDGSGRRRRSSRKEEQLWRTEAYNGTESRTTSLDEWNVRQMLLADVLDVMERNSKVPSPGWMGSHWSCTFLSSNSCSSTAVGCGAVDLCHPTGGNVYRFFKCQILCKILEARAGTSNLIRLLRLAFISSHLKDTEQHLPNNNNITNTATHTMDSNTTTTASSSPPFMQCLEELMKKGGYTHSSFTRILRVLSGTMREPYLRGTLVDACPSSFDKNNNKTTASNGLEPEGFPNSFIRGSSHLYLRVGAHVEPVQQHHNSSGTTTIAQQQQQQVQLQLLAEPVLPEGDIAYGGPMTIRIVENEGQCREFIRSLPIDGSRCDWGPIFLHANPVTTTKDRNLASGTLETTTATTKSSKKDNNSKASSKTNNNDTNKNNINSSKSKGTDNDSQKNNKSSSQKDDNNKNSKNSNSDVSDHTNNNNINNNKSDSANKNICPNNNNATTMIVMGAYNDQQLHIGGYCALELVRLTNVTPLLWVRVDPQGCFYGSRMSIYLPDACLAEQLFHDGDATSQLEAMRALAERPTIASAASQNKSRSGSSSSIIHGVKAMELPARVLGDCLRGSVALHADLPHNPAIRTQAAYCLSQWQNNKAPQSKDAIGHDTWIGLKILLQYFQERFSTNIIPTNDRNHNKINPINHHNNNNNKMTIMPTKFSRTILRKQNNPMNSNNNNNNQKKNSTPTNNSSSSNNNNNPATNNTDNHNSNSKNNKNNEVPFQSVSSINKNSNKNSINNSLNGKINNNDGNNNDRGAGSSNNNVNIDVSSTYHYLDEFTTDRSTWNALNEADEVEFEEDEEYRVRSAVVTSIACIRAKDGLTPPAVVEFLENLLAQEQDEPSSPIILSTPTNTTTSSSNNDDDFYNYDHPSNLQLLYSKLSPSSSSFHLNSISSTYMIADALLATSYINVQPTSFEDPISTTKNCSSNNGISANHNSHPCLTLLKLAYKWLEWDLYRQDLRYHQQQENQQNSQKKSSSFSDTLGNDESLSILSACAITSLCSLGLLRLCTSHDDIQRHHDDTNDSIIKKNSRKRKMTSFSYHDATNINLYMSIYNSQGSRRCDITKAAAAQAIACICCASDRLDPQQRDNLSQQPKQVNDQEDPVGLLSALEILLDQIVDPETSPGLRQTLACLMMDACTGKVCSMQRIAVLAGRTDIYTTSARFMNGPLGAGYGGDNGSALFLSPNTLPATVAVNDGARNGLKLLQRAGRDNSIKDQTVTRIATFATNLWRTINGESILRRPRRSQNEQKNNMIKNIIIPGVCAYDSHLRVSLLALLQWIWPKSCIAVLRVQSWKAHEGTQRYRDLGAHRVLKISDEERQAAGLEDASCEPLRNIVSTEILRQEWREDMAHAAYKQYKRQKEIDKQKNSNSVTVQAFDEKNKGIGQPLSIIKKDSAWKLGGWSASTAQQRRAKGSDGGTAVTKIRLTVKSND